MSAVVLEQLKSDDFFMRAGCLSTPIALRRVLSRAPEVASLQRALKQQAISEETLRQFVSWLLRDLRLGERFPHDLAIAALAVVLERRATDFAEEFLRDLSRLKLAEMSISIRVARECLKVRGSMTHSTFKHFPSPGNGEQPFPFSIGDSPAFLSQSAVGVERATTDLSAR
jgi:hypothetical protein